MSSLFGLYIFFRYDGFDRGINKRVSAECMILGVLGKFTCNVKSAAAKLQYNINVLY